MQNGTRRIRAISFVCGFAVDHILTLAGTRVVCLMKSRSAADAGHHAKPTQSYITILRNGPLYAVCCWPHEELLHADKMNSSVPSEQLFVARCTLMFLLSTILSMKRIVKTMIRQSTRDLGECRCVCDKCDIVTVELCTHSVLRAAFVQSVIHVENQLPPRKHPYKKTTAL